MFCQHSENNDKLTENVVLPMVDISNSVIIQIDLIMH